MAETLSRSVRVLLHKPGALLAGAGVADSVAYIWAHDARWTLGIFILQLYLLYRVWRFGGRLAWALLFTQVGFAVYWMVEAVTVPRVGSPAAFVVTQSVAVLVTVGALLSGVVRVRLQPLRLFRRRSDTATNDLL
jgi:hypothetical protein